MLDKRYKYRTQNRREIYLFIKDKRSHIYYAKFPTYGTTKSTRCCNLTDAYKSACSILSNLTNETCFFHKTVLDYYKDNHSVLTKAKHVLTFLPDVTDSLQLTETRVSKLVDTLLSNGVKPKTISNYLHILKKPLSTFPKYVLPKHVPTIRHSFPIYMLYGVYSKCNNVESLLAFFTMTTGIRAGELKTCIPVEHNGKRYLQINGTKTVNAVRKVPLLPESEQCYLKLKDAYYSNKVFGKSVVSLAEIIGLNEDYVKSNNITYHCFRRVYKTLLESMQVPNVFIEAWLGHSHTNGVNNLYFDVEASDDTIVYNKAVEALRRFV